MQPLQERTRLADSLLAPYAVKHGDGLGRMQQEEEDTTRLKFQRDRGRIVHTQEFRRLKGKTQVFVGGGGDHFRTRLTHTMEVAGISRDIARALRLNEDLSECIALAHDLGHPPFGHAGEEALDAWMKGQDSSFEHNVQSHRVVTILAEHSALFQGLNLNQEILDGLLKHRTPHDEPGQKGDLRAPSLEAQVVNIADEIAYSAHDCEDGLGAGLFTARQLGGIPLAKEAYMRAHARGTSLRGALIHLLITDLYQATEEEIASHRITTLDGVYAAHAPLVHFSAVMQSLLTELRQFLWDHMYNHPSVLEMSSAGKAVVTSLCGIYVQEPTEKVLSLQNRTKGSLPEAVKDYVAGMTDAYAFLQAEGNGIPMATMRTILGRNE
ncbi:MAG: dNTP triphosphohydrolase [Candidatus Peribacteraceae bacterium]|nr:dNTP triphosphohydrolase [Candidatus Peribacteraceae bacterium]